MVGKRDDFTRATKDLLSRRVGTECSNPKCQKRTSGPNISGDGIVNIGVAAHITAASPGGPRYDSSLSKSHRSSHSNGIWLCQACAKLIDDDAVGLAAGDLHEWKKTAERRARTRVESSEVSNLVILSGALLVGATTQTSSVQELISRFPSIASGFITGVPSAKPRKLMFDEVERFAKKVKSEDIGLIIESLPSLLESGGIDSLTVLFNFLDVLIETRAHHPELATNSTEVIRMLDRMITRVETATGLVPLQKATFLELLATVGLTFGTDLFFSRYLRASDEANLVDASVEELRKTLIWSPNEYYGDYETAVQQLKGCLRNPNYRLAHAYQTLLLAVTESRPIDAIVEEFGLDIGVRRLISGFRLNLGSENKGPA